MLGMKVAMNADEQAVAEVLAAYEGVLNASDVEGAVALYAPDGIFMPQNSPSSIGADAVRAAYQAVFRAITLKVKFTVAEVKQLGPDWVMARTNSAGTATPAATGVPSAEANQELFVFERVAGAWKIARYCFCTTNPPKA